MFINVDLPEPDAPMIATNSPRSIVRADATQRSHLEVAQLVGLMEIGNAYDDVCHGYRVQQPEKFGSGGYADQK